jgi:hypothetical protein
MKHPNSYTRRLQRGSDGMLIVERKSVMILGETCLNVVFKIDNTK